MYAGTRVFVADTLTLTMVTPDEVREKGMTREDVMDIEFVEPREEPEWLPEWDDHPDARPGENTRIEDGVLKWERDGFSVELESHNTTHWKATVSIPEYAGKYYPRDIDLKCKPKPKYGFVESVDIDSYVTTGATLIIQENFQPVVEVNSWIDELIESAEQSEAYQEEVEELLAAASENDE